MTNGVQVRRVIRRLDLERKELLRLRMGLVIPKKKEVIDHAARELGVAIDELVKLAA